MQNEQENTAAGVLPEFLLQNSYTPQAWNFLFLKETFRQVISCKFCEFFQTTHIAEHLRATASVGFWSNESWGCMTKSCWNVTRNVHLIFTFLKPCLLTQMNISLMKLGFVISRVLNVLRRPTFFDEKPDFSNKFS